jgi:hypothetical protein
MELLLAIVGGSCGSAIVAGLFGLVTWKLNRKAQKEDHAATRKVADCAARGEEIRELNRKMDVLFLADRTILYDRIKFLAKAFINRGWVTVEELEDLNRMHAVYHDSDKLNGNGFLDKLMKKVNTDLEIRAA